MVYGLRVLKSWKNHLCLKKALSGFLCGVFEIFIFWFFFFQFLVLSPSRIMIEEWSHRARKLDAGDTGKPVSLFLLFFLIIPTMHMHTHMRTHTFMHTHAHRHGQISKPLRAQQTNHETLIKRIKRTSSGSDLPPFSEPLLKPERGFQILPSPSSGPRTPRYAQFHSWQI